MLTKEELDNQILRTIEEQGKTESDRIQAWFTYQNNPTLLDDKTLLAVIRWRRTALLHSSDWTQISDCTIDKEACATYRQQLRDLPSSNANPRLIVFPQPPEPLT